MIFDLPATYDTWKTTPPGDDDVAITVWASGTAAVELEAELLIPRSAYMDRDQDAHGWAQEHVEAALKKAISEVLHQYGVSIELEDLELNHDRH